MVISSDFAHSELKLLRDFIMKGALPCSEMDILNEKISAEVKNIFTSFGINLELIIKSMSNKEEVFHIEVPAAEASIPLESVIEIKDNDIIMEDLITNNYFNDDENSQDQNLPKKSDSPNQKKNLSEMIDSLLEYNMRKKATCKICNYTNGKKREIHSHVESKHLRVAIFCKFCKFIAKSKNSISSHLKSFHEEKFEESDIKNVINDHVNSAEVEYYIDQDSNDKFMDKENTPRKNEVEGSETSRIIFLIID